MFPDNAASSSGEFRRTIAVSPDSKAVYDSLNGQNALRQMTVTDGSLRHRRTYVNYEDGITGMTGPQVIGVAPDGGCVYVSGSSGVVAFRRDASTNDLTFASSYATPGFLNEMAFSSDGRYLYSSSGGSLAVLNRDASTCALSANSTTEFEYGGYPTGLALSPDEKNLYAIDSWGKHILIFTRDASTGAVELSQTLTQGVGGVSGLDGVSGIVISPDGKYAYTTAYVENALAIWERDASNRRVVPAQSRP